MTPLPEDWLSRIIIPTEEEDAEINAQIAANPDAYELDDEWFARAKPTHEFFPEWYQWDLQRQAAIQSGELVRLTITVPREVAEWFRCQGEFGAATGGNAWKVLIEQMLEAHVAAQTADAPVQDSSG